MKDGKHTDSYGTERWYQNGKRHRTDGPAYTHPSGTQSWHQNGELHRTDGPAIVHQDGTQHWYQNGKLHRTDGPAIVYPDGTLFWCQNGQYHRTDGPAHVGADGTQEWYQNGELHRTDGPAIVHQDGTQSWYINDNKLTESEIKAIKDNINTTKPKEVKMKDAIVVQAKRIKDTIKPYEQYIVIGALLIALDHFILKGALRGKIAELGIALGNKFTAILNKAIEKLEV